MADLERNAYRAATAAGVAEDAEAEEPDAPLVPAQGSAGNDPGGNGPDAASGRSGDDADTETETGGEKPADAALGASVADGSMRRGEMWRAGLRAALPAWVAAHVLVLVVQDLAAHATPNAPAKMPTGPVLHHLFNQLFTWDTAWYIGIAQSGYSGVASDGIRFWPLLPLVTRSLDVVGIGPATGVLVVCWVAALVFGVLMYRFALEAGADAAAARRTVWLSQLAPGAFVLVMGYTEALAGMLAATFLIAVRQAAPGRGGSREGGENDGGRRIWLWHLAGFIAGYCSGLVRPTGWLLALPGAVEALRQWRDPKAHTAARLLTAASPLLGVGTFLWWSDKTHGQWLLPYKTQELNGLRGTVAQSPIPSLLDSLNQSGNGAGAFTVILVVASLGLLWVCVRRMPVSYWLWTAVSIVSVITAPHFSSYARYASGFLPLLVAGAMITTDRRAWRWSLFASAAFCAYFAYQSFIGVYIP